MSLLQYFPQLGLKSLLFPLESPRDIQEPSPTTTETQQPSRPAYGKRLLVSRVDELAETNPTGIFASFAKCEDFSQGFTDLDWRAVGNAVSRLAWWLESVLGGKSDRFETVGYVGESDVRYLFLVLATNKTGHKVCFLDD